MMAIDRRGAFAAAIVAILVLGPFVGAMVAAIRHADRFNERLGLSADTARMMAGMRVRENNRENTAEYRLGLIEITLREQEATAESFQIWVLCGIATMCLLTAVIGMAVLYATCGPGGSATETAPPKVSAQSQTKPPRIRLD